MLTWEPSSDCINAAVRQSRDELLDLGRLAGPIEPFEDDERTASAQWTRRGRSRRARKCSESHPGRKRARTASLARQGNENPLSWLRSHAGRRTRPPVQSPWVRVGGNLQAT